MRIICYYILLIISLNSCSTTSILYKDGNAFIRDKRDGKQYHVAILNGHWWMVDNFAMEIPEAVPYKKGNSGGPPLGLIYTYESIKNAAPKGWRLPTADELANLF